MSRTVWIVILASVLLVGGLASVLLVGGSGLYSGANPVYQERIDLIAEAAVLLEGVKDETTATAAAERAEQIAVRLRENRTETDRLSQAGLWKQPTWAQIEREAAVVYRYTQALNHSPNLRGTKNYLRRLTLAMQKLDIIKE
jgi:hypothetical protein